ncbi:MAG: hypothetical protein KF878_28040 [Planctomycetes bacterium]|nr:hypothetical protein [Planctomycetota bacterium]
MTERGPSWRGGRGAPAAAGAGADRPARRPGPDRPRDDRPGPGRRRRLATPIEQARAALRASPGYAVAAFVHLLAIVLLSIVGVVAAVQERERPPVTVRLVSQPRVDVVTATPGALLDDVAPPLPAEVDVAAPSHEALGATLGDLAADAVLGLAGAAGAGRGGQADARGGASAGSDAGIRGGLDWLVRHRAADGAWNVLPTAHARGALPRRGDSGITALALLCFLSAGPAEAVDARHGDLVDHATAWLAARVDRHGVVLSDLPERTPKRSDPADSTWHWLPAAGYEGYHQATVTLALAQALARREDPAVRSALQRAAACLEAAQDRKRGGWAYQPGLAGYTSLSGWAIMALRAAEQAGVEVQPGTWEAARGFLGLVSRPDGQTRYNRTQSGFGGHGMNASGLFMRLVLGEPPTTARNAAAAALVATVAEPRAWDACETYYAALAMHQVGGAPWLRFNAPVRDAVVARQRQDGCERGSWSDEGQWLGGDPMTSTLFATLTLETYYRYGPVHAPGEPARPQEPTLAGTLESLRRVEALPAQERPAALGRVEVALRAAADRPAERPQLRRAWWSRRPGRRGRRVARRRLHGGAAGRRGARRGGQTARRGALLKRALALLEGVPDGAPVEGRRGPPRRCGRSRPPCARTWKPAWPPTTLSGGRRRSPRRRSWPGRCGCRWRPRPT